MLRLPAALLGEFRLIGSAVGFGGRLIAELEQASGWLESHRGDLPRLRTNTEADQAEG
jgi:hypothetical protein